MICLYSLYTIRRIRQGPRYKWLNADIWYATSPVGVHWTEKGPAVKRGPKGSWDDFSVFTRSRQA
jgi:hypothetical protein